MLPAAGVGVVICLAIRNFLRNNYSQDPKYVKQRQEDAKWLADPTNKPTTFKAIATDVVKTMNAPESERVEWRKQWAREADDMKLRFLAAIIIAPFIIVLISLALRGCNAW